MKPRTLLINVLTLSLLWLFFFFFGFDTSYKYQLLVKNPMALKLRETIFCVIETKFYKAVQARFLRKFNLSTCPGKPQVFLWYRNFQTYETINKRSKKSENRFSERKLSTRSVDNVEASSFLFAVARKSPFDFALIVAKNIYFHIVCRSCTQFPSTRWILGLLATFIYSFIRLKVTIR